MLKKVVQFSCLSAIIAGSAMAVQPAQAADEVNLYSYRQPFLIEPLLNKFTAETGIKVNVVFAKKGMLEKIKAAGDNNPADAVLTVDIGRLYALKQADVFVLEVVVAVSVPVIDVSVSFLTCVLSLTSASNGI